MMKISDDNSPEDTVKQILQKGYQRDGHVIRPAKVIISKQTPPPPPPKEEKKEEIVNEEDAKEKGDSSESKKEAESE